MARRKKKKPARRPTCRRCLKKYRKVHTCGGFRVEERGGKSYYTRLAPKTPGLC